MLSNQELLPVFIRLSCTVTYSFSKKRKQLSWKRVTQILQGVALRNVRTQDNVQVYVQLPLPNVRYYPRLELTISNIPSDRY